MHFDDIEYLRTGTERQQRAHSVLVNHQILRKLKHFDPILVGTIPINIDTEKSDLDIICCFSDQQVFQAAVERNFGSESGFRIRERQHLDGVAVITNCRIGGFEIEIFGQSVPTRSQVAYRHLCIEYRLLTQYGEGFRQQIVELKRQGYKTEPAFALVLGLVGDPYLELLKLESQLGD